VAFGVVVGFPLLTALALEEFSSSHGAVIVGLLPAATAVMAVLRAGERPSLGFWLACATGTVAVLVFAAFEGAGTPRFADLLVLAAVAVGALGYAEGGALAREIGGWRVICWTLLLASPFIAMPVMVAVSRSGLHAELRPGRGSPTCPSSAYSWASSPGIEGSLGVGLRTLVSYSCLSRC
jgi:drug/metabolite transporter (DMT)-like permease